MIGSRRLLVLEKEPEIKLEGISNQMTSSNIRWKDAAERVASGSATLSWTTCLRKRRTPTNKQYAKARRMENTALDME
jgi:ribulose 1,5-bisphosphate carboxylase large subunit-like protein